MNDGWRPEAEKAQKRKAPSDPLRKAVIVSLVLHLGIVVLAITGIPWLNPLRKVSREQPIVVDLVMRGEVTKAPAPAKKKPSNPLPPKPTPPKPEPSPPTPPKPEPAPSPPPPPKPEPAPSPPPPPKPEPAPSPSPPPKPEEKPAPPKELKQASKPADDPFASLLQNVERFRQEQSVASEATPSVRGSEALVADEATLSDIDALRAQIEKNWTFDPGMKGVTEMEIVLRVLINRDGSVAAVRFEDMGRYSSDPRYRVLADSARRAVEKSQPLIYPPEKYDIFRDIVLSFRPKDRL